MSLIYDNQTYPSLQEFVKIGVLEAKKKQRKAAICPSDRWSDFESIRFSSC